MNHFILQIINNKFYIALFCLLISMKTKSGKAEAGDHVRLITKDKEYHGILMPRPELLEKGFTVLKLDNGYNIGIEDKKIQDISLVKKHEPKKEIKRQVKHKKGLPSVSILSFGGTISSKVDYRTGGTYADYTAEDFVQMCPELSDIANIKAKKVMGKMSEDFNKNDWQDMAKAIKAEIDSGVDGIVVSQGTDTLHFSTAAISFMLEDLPVPVVFTASQRSIDRGSTDAFMNLICAVNAAANFDAAEVMTCMHGTTDDDYCLLIRGTKVRKMHTSRRDAFRPINDLPFAKVYKEGKIEILNDNYRKRKEDKTKTKQVDGFEDKTALLYVYPNFDPSVIDYYVNKGYKGIVIGATALGHVASEGKRNVLPFIENAIKAGLIIVIASQTIYGSTHRYVYTTLRKLSVELSCIFADDMLPETAYVKLGWALGNAKTKEEAEELFKKDIAGESKDRRLASTFLY